MRARLVLFAVFVALATAASAAGDPVFEGYEQVRQGLLRGDVGRIQGAAGDLAAAAEKVGRDGIQQQALVVQRATDLQEARSAFAALSEAVIAYRETRCCERPVVVHCAMEKKSWLQPEGKIENPYVAASMRSCGKVVDATEGRPRSGHH
jgi:hypothetical protein